MSAVSVPVTRPVGAETSGPARTVRAPSDVLRVVVAGALLIVVSALGLLFQDTLVANTGRLLVGLDTISPTAVGVVASAAEMLAVVVIGGGLLLAVLRRKWTLLGSELAAVLVAMVVAALLSHLFDNTVSVTSVNEQWTLLSPSSLTTVQGLAAVAAFVTASAPWVTRRWRRAGWTVVILVTAVRVVAAPVSLQTPLALLAGWTAGAAAVVAFGAPSRRPTPAAVATGLAAVGVPLASIEPLSVDARGSTPYLATSTDGEALFVKALGDDERSADLLFRLYRYFRHRDYRDERPFSSLRRMVEHEALVALDARQLGVRTPRFVALATAQPNGYALAYEAVEGRSLDRVDATDMTDQILAAVWEQLVLLRSHRLAHRDLRLANVFQADDGQVWIIDFGFAELAASEVLLATDLAELLASSSTKVGAARALAVARSAVGDTALAGARDRLQPALLSGATRQALKENPETLTELRTAVQRLAGRPAPMQEEKT
jgi:undecaprenyl-diphosphatase